MWEKTHFRRDVNDQARELILEKCWNGFKPWGYISWVWQNSGEWTLSSGVLGKSYVRNWRQGKRPKLKHFVTEGTNKAVVYTMPQRLQINGQVDLKMNKAISGNTIAWKVCNKIRKQIKHHVGISQQKLAQRFKINQMSRCTVLGEGNLSYHKLWMFHG